MKPKSTSFTNPFVVVSDSHEDELDDMWLPPVSDFLDGMLEPVEPQLSPVDNSMTYLDTIDFNLPVELQVEQQEDSVRLRMSPPMQQTETTIFPVLHRFRLKLGVTKDA